MTITIETPKSNITITGSLKYVSRKSLLVKYIEVQYVNNQLKKLG